MLKYTQIIRSLVGIETQTLDRELFLFCSGPVNARVQKKNTTLLKLAFVISIILIFAASAGPRYHWGLSVLPVWAGIHVDWLTGVYFLAADYWTFFYLTIFFTCLIMASVFLKYRKLFNNIIKKCVLYCVYHLAVLKLSFSLCFDYSNEVAWKRLIYDKKHESRPNPRCFLLPGSVVSFFSSMA